VIPLAVLSAVSLIPYVFPRPAEAELGEWFPQRNRLAQAFFAFLLLSIGILTVIALLPAS